MIFSAEDESRPSPRLINVALDAARAAQEISLPQLDARLDGPPYWPSIWPGEHYRLLAALAETLQARTIIEIGTATGMSGGAGRGGGAPLAALAGAPQGSRVVTFDIVPWREYPGTVLTEEDFADGRLAQQLDDLSTPDGAHKHRELLIEADLIFVDAAKDGHQEEAFLELFETIPFSRAPIVVFDDIRQWKMLAIWRRVRRPKLDITSFGHWSGTGLVDFG
jgi:predicted O-methyltransferase YrrM